MDLLTLLISILIIVLVVGVLVWATDLLSASLGLPHPFPVIIKVILVLLGLVFILNRVGFIGPVLR